MITFASLALFPFSLLSLLFRLLNIFLSRPTSFLAFTHPFLFTHPTGTCVGGERALSHPPGLAHSTRHDKICHWLIFRCSHDLYLCRWSQRNRQHFCLMLATLSKLCIIGLQWVRWLWVQIVYSSRSCWAIARCAALVSTAILLAC